jgi:poly(3-hydroxybutyrate) depolymerase
VPAAYNGTSAVPVVFNFHGYGSNAVQQIDSLGKTTSQIDASATIWDFFQAHPLP